MLRAWVEKNHVTASLLITVFLLLAVAWIFYGIWGHSYIDSQYQKTGYLDFFHMGGFEKDKVFTLKYYQQKADAAMVACSRLLLIFVVFFLLLRAVFSNFSGKTAVSDGTAQAEKGHPGFLSCIKIRAGGHSKTFLAFLFFAGAGLVLYSLFAQPLPQLAEIHRALASLGILLVLVLFFLSAEDAKAVGLLVALAVVNLYAKVTIVMLPIVFGAEYVKYATHLGTPVPEISNHLFSPWLAHWLGFASREGWLLFLAVFFLMGISFIYLSACRMTQDRVFAFLLAMIPVASTTGWNGVYSAGDPDWIVLALLIFAFLVRSDGMSFFFAAVAMLVHERAIFVLPALPFLRAVTKRQFERNKLQRNLWIILGIILAYLLAQKFVFQYSAPTPGFYLNGLILGQPQFSAYPITARHMLIAVAESYKVILLPVILCIFILLRSRSRVARIGLGVFTLSAGVVLFQLFVAVDSVRLLDFLIFPVILIFILVHQIAPSLRKALKILILAALCLNQLLPVTYLAQNINVLPESILHDKLWGYKEIPDFMMHSKCSMRPVAQGKYVMVKDECYDKVNMKPRRMPQNTRPKLDG